MKMNAILKSFDEKDRKYLNERKSLDQAHFRSKIRRPDTSPELLVQFKIEQKWKIVPIELTVTDFPEGSGAGW